jgi:hypothetical protein
VNQRLDEGRRQSASASLLAVADRDLFRGNPFRVTGLPTDAPRTKVRELKQKVLSAIRIGAPLPIPAPPPPAEPPSEEQVLKAFEVLDEPERRLVAELFWLWGQPGDCGCGPGVHDDHDVAVLAHAAALERSPGDSPDTASWHGAAGAWSRSLSREVFWHHVRSRMGRLGDRSLDESTVDGLREVLPRALVGPLAATIAEADDPAPLMPCLDGWPVDRYILDEVRMSAAAGVLKTVDALADEAHGLINDGKPVDATHLVLRKLVPAGNRLERVLPHQRFRRSSTIRQRIALALNNCGVDLSEHADWRKHKETLRRLFDLAADFAMADDTKDLVRRNRTLTERQIALDNARHPYDGFRPPPPGPYPPSYREPVRQPILPPYTWLSRLAALAAYCVALTFLMVAAAPSAALGLLVLAGVPVFPCVLTGSRRMALTYVGVVCAVFVPVAIVIGTGALSRNGSVALGAVAGLALTAVVSVQRIVLAVRKT